MKALSSSKVYVKKTDNTGFGLFANTFLRGGIHFLAEGRILKHKIISQKYSQRFKCRRCLGIDKMTWINPYKNNPLYYINHSCNPNAGINGKRRFYAMRDIDKDEEITFDYSISEVDVYWTMTCTCKQRNCRGVIRSIQFLPTATYQKYLPYIPTYFSQVYRNSKGSSK